MESWERYSFQQEFPPEREKIDTNLGREIEEKAAATGA